MPRGTRKERARAHAARSKAANTDGAPRPAAAEGDRARAADGTTPGRESGRGQDTGRARRGAGRAPRCMEQSEGRWASRQANAWVTGGGTHSTGRGTEALGAGRGPKGKGKGATGPQRQAGRGMGARGGGRVEGRGAGGGPPPQQDVQPVRCIPPGIRQMPAHHTHHHHHHHHHHLYNIRKVYSVFSTVFCLSCCLLLV